jgi:hypothetical protein
MKIIEESGLAKAIEMELLIPDPINIAKGVEIIENATNDRTTRNNTESNRENCS